MAPAFDSVGCIATASAVLPAQLLSCLPESPCVVACFTRRQGLFNEFCEQLAAYVQEMDCVYLVNWDAWMPRIRDCMPVVVQRPGDGEDEEGGGGRCGGRGGGGDRAGRR